MDSNDTIVRRFCEAFERLDAGELIAYFAGDALYHNMPMQPLRGHAAIRAFFSDIPNQFEGLRFEIVNQVATGNLVMNERVDYFLSGGRTIALPVAGIFEMENGKIKAWRDYFNLATLQQSDRV